LDGMKTHHSEKAFTLLELLVVIFIVAILLAMLMPASTGPHKSHSLRVLCMSNQRQIALALVMFSQDHGGNLPWQVSATNGSSIELVSANQTSFQFRGLSNYFSKQTRCFVCPYDSSREAATNFASLSDSNLSYFLNLDGIANQNSIWTGDRYLESQGKPIKPGVFIQTTNVALQWSAGFHGFQNKPCGIFSFGDGHVQVVRGDQLSSCFQKQPTATNRFCFP